MTTYHILKFFPVVAIFVAGSCGIDSSLKPSEPLVATVTIGPAEFARTAETIGLWTDEIVLVLPVDPAEHEDDPNDGHGKMTVMLDAIGDTVIDGMRIEMELVGGRDMFRHKLGQWTEQHAEPDEQHVIVRLEDAREEDDHGSGESVHPNMFNAEVTLSVSKVGETLEEHALEAIMGHDGFFYGGDFSITAEGDYDITVTVGPPTFTRGEDTQDKWMVPAEGTLSYTYHGELDHDEEIGSFETAEELEVTVSAEEPESLWHFEHGELEEHTPDPSATHFFVVTVRDHSSEVHSQGVGYVDVTIGFGDEGEHPTVESKCEPMFDHDGFHYGINMMLPEAGGTNHDDGHEGDDDPGDGHDDDHGGGK